MFVILVSLVPYSQCKVYPVYWLQNMFGDQGITKLNNKKSVQLFVKFLSDLVPCEPAEYLKVNVVCTIFDNKEIKECYCEKPFLGH